MPAPTAVKMVTPIAKVIRYGSQCPGHAGSVVHTHHPAAAYPAKMTVPSAAPIVAPIASARNMPTRF